MSRRRFDEHSFKTFQIQSVAARQVPLAMTVGVCIYVAFTLMVIVSGGSYTRGSLLLLLAGGMVALAAAALCFTMAQRGNIDGVMAGVVLFQVTAVFTIAYRAQLDHLGSMHVSYLCLLVLLPTPLVAPNRMWLGVNLALVFAVLSVVLLRDPNPDPYLNRHLAGFVLASTAMLVYLWRMSQAAIWSYYRLLQDARERSSTDALTGLPNRAAWTEQVQSWIGASTHGDPPPATVLYMDMDDMKLVNDQFGHAAGDRVLVEIADTLRKALPPTAILARFGGDEFVAFFPDMGPETVARVMDRLQAAISQNVHTQGQTIGVGMTQYRHPEPMDSALERADINLIEMKRLRRSGLESAPPSVHVEPASGLMTAQPTGTSL